MALGDLVVRLSADVASFQRDLGRAHHMAEKFADNVKRVIGIAATGLGVGAFAGFIKGAIDAADNLNDLRARTGLTGQELLTLQGAAERSGVQLSEVGDITSKLTRRMIEAQKGTGDAAAAYQAMGISVTDAGGNLKNTGQILQEVGAKFRTYEDGANKSALAIAALGKGGDRLIPMIEAIEETRKRFERLGITISEDVITAADKFKDTMKDVDDLNKVIARNIAAALLPHLQQTAEAMTEIAKQAAGVKLAVDVLITPIKALATGFIAVGGAIAAAAEMMVGFYLAGHEFRKFNFGKGLDEWRIAVERSEKTLQGMMSTVSALWNKGGGQAAGITDPFEAWGPNGPWGKRQAPRLPDLAAGKAAEDALRKLLDQRTKLELDALKDLGKNRETLLDAMHAADLVSERDYWAQKFAIQRQALDAELSVINQQISRQEAALSKAKRGTKDYHEAQGNLEESLARRNKLERDFSQVTAMSYFAAQKRADDYRRSVEELDAQILELTGHTAEAARVRMDLQNEELRRRFTVNNDQDALQKLDRLEQLTIQQAQFNQAREDLSIITERLQMQEERLQNSLRLGAIGEIEALNKTGELRKQAVAQLEAQVVALEAAARGNAKLELQAEQARASLERLKQETDLLAQKFDTVFRDSASDALSDFITRTKTAKEAFTSFINSVVTQINRMAINELATKIFGKPGASGGFGDFFAKLFGGSAAGAAGGIGYGAADAGSAMVMGAGGAMIPALATGMDYVPRDMPAFLHRGEAVLTAEENASRGQPITIINQFPPGTTMQTINQAAAATGFAARDAMRRKGR